MRVTSEAVSEKHGDSLRGVAAGQADIDSLSKVFASAVSASLPGRLIRGPVTTGAAKQGMALRRFFARQLSTVICRRYGVKETDEVYLHYGDIQVNAGAACRPDGRSGFNCFRFEEV